MRLYDWLSVVNPGNQVVDSGFFLRNRLREFVPAVIASIIAKFGQILMGAFSKYCEKKF